MPSSLTLECAPSASGRAGPVLLSFRDGRPPSEPLQLRLERKPGSGRVPDRVRVRARGQRVSFAGAPGAAHGSYLLGVRKKGSGVVRLHALSAPLLMGAAEPDPALAPAAAAAAAAAGRRDASSAAAGRGIGCCAALTGAFPRLARGCCARGRLPGGALLPAPFAFLQPSRSAPA